MPVRKKKRARARGRSKAGSPKPPAAAAKQSAEFVAALIRRGEAAYPMEDGRLPPGATHEIVDEGPGKPPSVVRRRFSIT